MVVHFKSSAHRLVTRINSLCGAVLLLLLVRFVLFVSCAWIKLLIVGEGSTVCVSKQTNSEQNEKFRERGGLCRVGGRISAVGVLCAGRRSDEGFHQLGLHQ